MKKVFTPLCLLFFSFTACHAYGQPVIAYQTIASGFTRPVKVVNAGDSRLFVGENTGMVKVVLGSKQILATPFLDLSSKTDINSISGGFLSIVFHPNYKTNGYFFVLYTEKSSALRTSNAVTLARYKVSATDSNKADPASEAIVLKIPKPLNPDSTVSIEHNGSDLYFGRDGNLYLTIGDGMSAEPADPLFLSQNVQSLFGKMLRINVNNFTTPPYYTIPLTNPFNLGKPNNARKEIYSTGLRNPFRWSFDRLNGDMYIGDVGQNKWEEIDYTSYNTQLFAYVQWAIAVLFRTDNRKPVSNFGWSCYEGNDPYVNVAKCSTSQGLTFPIYQYTNSTPTQHGYAAVTGGFVYRGTQYPALYGYYMAADFFTGNMYFLKKNSAGQFSPAVQTLLQGGITGFGEDVNGELYVTSYYTGQVFKITVPSVALRQAARPHVSAEAAMKGAFKVYPSITSVPAFKIYMNKPALLLHLINVDGKVVYQKSLQNIQGTISIDAPGLHSGIYFIKIFTAQGIESHKLIVL